jgi:hypothetical protein
MNYKLMKILKKNKNFIKIKNMINNNNNFKNHFKMRDSLFQKTLIEKVINLMMNNNNNKKMQVLSKRIKIK